MRALIAVLPGDGIGAEVVTEGVRVLETIAARFGHTFDLEAAAIGGQAIDREGTPLPDATIALCKRAAAVLVGAVGGDKWDVALGDAVAEGGLVRLHDELGLFACIRPVLLHPKASHVSPVKQEIVDKVNVTIVYAIAENETAASIERVVRVALACAHSRKKKLASVDTSGTAWRDAATNIARAEYPEVVVTHERADAAAMNLVRKPADYDVIVTGKVFGEIASGIAGVLAGSLGMLPSATVGEGRRGIFAPVHGPRGVANPYGTILSVAMLLRGALGLDEEARAIEGAAWWTLGRGLATVDVSPERPRKTHEVTTAILDAMARRAQAAR